MASPTRWAWVWVNSGSWWWTGRPGLLQFMGSQRVRHDWVTELGTGGWWRGQAWHSHLARLYEDPRWSLAWPVLPAGVSRARGAPSEDRTISTCTRMRNLHLFSSSELLPRWAWLLVEGRVTQLLLPVLLHDRTSSRRPWPWSPWWAPYPSIPGGGLAMGFLEWREAKPSAEGRHLLCSHHSAASWGQGRSLPCSTHFWKGFSDSCLSVCGSERLGLCPVGPTWNRRTHLNCPREWLPRFRLPSTRWRHTEGEGEAGRDAALDF